MNSSTDGIQKTPLQVGQLTSRQIFNDVVNTRQQLTSRQIKNDVVNTNLDMVLNYELHYSNQLIQTSYNNVREWKTQKV